MKKLGIAVVAAAAFVAAGTGVAHADGSGGAQTPWGGGSYSDGPANVNGVFWHCANVSVLGFGGQTCGWACPNPGNPSMPFLNVDPNARC